MRDARHYYYLLLLCIRKNTYFTYSDLSISIRIFDFVFQTFSLKCTSLMDICPYIISHSFLSELNKWCLRWGHLDSVCRYDTWISFIWMIDSKLMMNGNHFAENEREIMNEYGLLAILFCCCRSHWIINWSIKKNTVCMESHFVNSTQIECYLSFR